MEVMSDSPTPEAAVPDDADEAADVSTDDDTTVEDAAADPALDAAEDADPDADDSDPAGETDAEAGEDADAESDLEDPDADEPVVLDSAAPKKAKKNRGSLQATSTRRALALTALGALLIAGLVTVLPLAGDSSPLGGLAKNAVNPVASRATETFDNAKAGDCLTWDSTPDQSTVVDCAEDHLFEVAEAIDMKTFPGSEYAPGAPAPSPTRIQQIVSEQCQVGVRNYLGARYDPDGRFTVSMLWPGEEHWKSGERRMLCGLQLPGASGQQAFRGRIAETDQSKVWSPGTCLGIAPTTNQPTDTPVDCAEAHAEEITGVVNLAEKFPGGLPSDEDQDTFIKEQCADLTEAYLDPVAFRATTLTLFYKTIGLPSWTAGSRQVACRIGATLGNGGWATLVNTAKGPLLINGQPPVPPPDIPAERLNMPAVTVPTTPSYTPQYVPQYTPQYDDSSQSQSNSNSNSNSDSSSSSSDQSSDDSSSDTGDRPEQHGNTFNPGAPGPPAEPAAPAAPEPAAPAAPGPAPGGAPPGPVVP